MSQKCVVSFPDATSTQSWHLLHRLYYILNPWKSNHLFWGCCMYTSWTSHSHGLIECRLIGVFPRCSTLIGALFSSVCGTGSCTSPKPWISSWYFPRIEFKNPPGLNIAIWYDFVRFWYGFQAWQVLFTLLSFGTWLGCSKSAPFWFWAWPRSCWDETW